MRNGFRSTLAAIVVIGSSSSAFADVISDWNEKIIALIAAKPLTIDGIHLSPTGATPPAKGFTYVSASSKASRTATEALLSRVATAKSMRL